MSNTAYGQYLDRICSYDKINEKEIHELYRNKTKEAVIEEIVLRNLQFVIHLVRAWIYSASKYGIDYMDLLAAANMAMFKATQKFNPELGSYYKYVCSYVNSYLEAEIYKHLNYSRLYSKKRVKQGVDINPSDSFDKVIANNNEDEPFLLQDILVSPDDKNENIRLEVNNMLSKLENAKKSVHPLASHILELRYGVGRHRNCEPLPLSSVAEKLMLSKEGIRKIENKALAYLRKL